MPTKTLFLLMVSLGTSQAVFAITNAGIFGLTTVFLYLNLTRAYRHSAVTT